MGYRRPSPERAPYPRIVPSMSHIDAGAQRIQKVSPHGFVGVTPERAAALRLEMGLGEVGMSADVMAPAS